MAFHLQVPGASAGFLGVDLFFVLSGFLITSSLSAEWLSSRGIRFRRFYLRRLLRLLPGLCLLLLICGFLVPQSDQLAALLGVANWAMALGIVPGMNQRLLVHTWSLASEWQYYLLWAPALAMLLRWQCSRRNLVLALILMAFASACWRALLWHLTGSIPRVHYALDTRADGLLLGSALALLLSDPKWVNYLRARPWLRFATWLAFSVTTLFFASSASFEFLVYGGHTIFMISATVLLCGIVVAPSSLLVDILAHPGPVWMGTISYGLYLWHVPIHQYLQTQGYHAGEPVTILVVTCLSFAAAAFSYYLVEAPILRCQAWLTKYVYPEGYANR